MITVRKGNVELDVPADQKERYIKLGYSVVDKTSGRVVEAAPSNDVGELQAQIFKLTEENSALKAEIAKLSSKKTSSKEKAESK